MYRTPSPVTPYPTSLPRLRPLVASRLSTSLFVVIATSSLHLIAAARLPCVSLFCALRSTAPSLVAASASPSPPSAPMPVPRLLVYPIPIAVAMFITYELGFAVEKPAWYRKGLADDYRQIWIRYRDEQAGHPQPPPSEAPSILPSLRPHIRPPPQH